MITKFILSPRHILRFDRNWIFSFNIDLIDSQSYEFHTWKCKVGSQRQNTRVKMKIIFLIFKSKYSGKITGYS